MGWFDWFWGVLKFLGLWNKTGKVRWICVVLGTLLACCYHRFRPVSSKFPGINYGDFVQRSSAESKLLLEATNVP